VTTNTQLNTSGTILTLAEGGTGVSTMTTAYAPICAGTTAAGVLQPSSTGLGTSSNVFISNGPSALPSFQAMPNPIIKASTTLSTLNIQSMYATPVQVLAAQGAHTLIVVYLTVFEYIFNTTNFTGGERTFGPLIQYTNGIHGSGVVVGISNMDITTLGPFSSSAIFYGGAYDGDNLGNVNFGASTQGINEGLFATNITAPYVGGDGSMRITVYYSVLTTTL